MDKEEIIEEAKINAQVEGKKLIDAARSMINSEKAAAINEIKDQVALLSLNIAEKLIGEKFSASTTQSEYIDKLLKETKLN